MYFLGLDFGTSGCRACLLDPAGQTLWQSALASETDALAPGFWRSGLNTLLSRIPPDYRGRIARIAVDGTSGTLLLTDEALQPLGNVLSYAVPLSGAARLAQLFESDPLLRARHLLSQVDYINALLLGFVPPGDIHNLMKAGFEPTQRRWQTDWLPSHRQSLLREVVPPGTPLGGIADAWVHRYGLSPQCTLCAGTTDSIAAFLAADVHTPGEAVTSLGSTLALKLISTQPIASTQHGVYSHWFGKYWLAGGASNSGGNVLRQFFTDTQLAQLSKQIDPDTDCPLALYPLLRPGERFPVADPIWQPVMSPRPANDIDWLNGLLQGIARIESTGYRLLEQLGAPYPTRVLTAGGGANNPTWLRLRERLLQVPVSRAACQHAACGAARLAMHMAVTH